MASASLFRWALVWSCLLLGTQATPAELPGAWFERAVVPEAESTAEAQRFLLKRLPTLTIPDTAAAWLDYAATLRRDLLEKVFLENVPDAWRQPELGVVWGDVLPHDGYVIRKLRYEAVPGLWMPALLYEPAGDAVMLPAVLNVNGHSYDNGKAETAEQIRCINLAKRGILALHPEWFCCGELHTGEYRHSNLAYLDAAGIRGVSLFYFYGKRALDILDRHPRCDRARIAMTGLSGGGCQTAFLSALDERIALTVPVAGYGGMKPRIETLRDLGDLEQVPSDFLTVADYAHVTALFAPRPALIVYNKQDNCCFLPEHALPATYDPAVPVYRLFGAESGFRYYINADPGTHNYEKDNREQFYRFLNEHFLPGAQRRDEEIPCDNEVHPRGELCAGVPAGNETFATLAEKCLAGMARPPIPERNAPEFAAWKEAALARLVDIVHPQKMAFTAEAKEVVSESAPNAILYLLKSDDWTLRALLLGGSNATLTLVIADEGIAKLSGTLNEIVSSNGQALVFDPLYLGANCPGGNRSGALAMVFDATGARLLGVQAGQIAAVGAWAAATLPVERIRLDCTGVNAAVAGLIAGALLEAQGIPVAPIAIHDAPDTLAELISKRVKYEDLPALFCYKLLGNFDLADLRALSGKPL